MHTSLSWLNLLTTLLLPALAAAQDRPPSRPNILFIYADDWSFADVACHGKPVLKTPHLDRIAREGTDFHEFTVCNPVCSPSRTAIVTGQYPARHRIHEAISSHEQNVARGMPDWLDPKVTLLPRLLKDAGYTTGHFGKWHLGGREGVANCPIPADYGYDDSAVYVGGGRDVWEGTSFEEKQNGGAQAVANFESAAATENALRFIRNAQGKPFYVNLWLHETHHLVSATDEEKLAYPDTPEPQKTFYSAITRADRLVGQMLDLLDELKLADNTIVIFSADNGPEDSHPNPGDKLYYSVGDTGGLRGRKRSLYLGGVNVPFLVRWPGHVPSGRVDKTSVLSGVDMLPTLCAAANVPLPADYQPDGVNALPAFLGGPFERERPIFWDWRGNHSKLPNWPELAMREGNFTLLRTVDGTRVELYDVAHDRHQETNLAPQETARVASMTQALLAWSATLPPRVVEGANKTPARKPAPNPAPSTTPGPDRAKAMARWDVNNDGVLTLAEYRDGLSNAANAEQRFRNFDKNGDGKLSREEFVGQGS
jgi:arylsulfatase A-like enzyme